MPSEQPNQPQETHQSLLNGSHSNTHMPIVGYEVAYLSAPSRPWVTWRGALVFISGAMFIFMLLNGGTK